MAWRAWSAMILLTAALGGLAASLWHIGDAIARREATPVVVNVPPAPASSGVAQPVAGEITVETNLAMEGLPGFEKAIAEELSTFPDDPPPHEGAMISVPHIVEPPDIIRIEIVEALPGRQITGERLVLPDGTVGLDFYGNIDVRGLTVDQIKINVILHMREFLPDATLGLVEVDPENGEVKAIPPKDSDRVYVEVVSYNSKFYFVSGDVNAPGRLPITGGETILDALNNVGGLAPTADRRNIRLHRPARGGQPAKTYAIDIEAIETASDPKANLQILSGDRLAIGRDKVIEATVKSQRLLEPLQTVKSHILYYANMRKGLKEAGLTEEQSRAAIEAFLRLHRDNAQRPDGPTFDEGDLRKALLPLEPAAAPRPEP